MSVREARAILRVRFITVRLADGTWAMMAAGCGFMMAVMPMLGFRFGNDGLVCVALVAVIVFLATSARRTARRCPRCKEVNREVAIFCAQCGTRLRDK